MFVDEFNSVMVGECCISLLGEGRVWFGAKLRLTNYRRTDTCLAASRHTHARNITFFSFLPMLGALWAQELSLCVGAPVVGGPPVGQN